MVALKAHEADRFLASPPEGVRLFLVYGSDSGAITERARALEQLALKRGGGEAVLRIGSDELSDEPGRVADEANSASLFGGEPVIALRVLDGRHNVVGALQPLFDRPPDAAWLVVEAGELNADQARCERRSRSSKAAVALPTYQLEGTGLDIVHPRRRRRTPASTIEPAALELLAENLGGDRLAIRGELEKLFLYAGDSKTSRSPTSKRSSATRPAAETDQADRRRAARRQRGAGDWASAACAPKAVFVSRALGALALRHLLQLQSLRAAMDTGASAIAALSTPPARRSFHAAAQRSRRSWSAGRAEDLREARGSRSTRPSTSRGCSRRSKTPRSPTRCTRSRCSLARAIEAQACDRHSARAVFGELARHRR